MRTWLRRLPDRWMPAASETMDAETRLRFRFGTQAWLIAWPLAVFWTVLSAMSGLWVATALNGWMVVLGPIVLWGLRRTSKLTPWFELSLGSALLLYGPGMLGQTPADETNLFFSVIIPLVAGFLYGRRATVVWTGITIVVATTSLLFAHAGFTLPASDPMPLVSKVSNVASALLMAALFSSTFHEVRRAALERAEAASKAKSLFLANISHELRTPMNGVLGMTEVMLEETKDPAARAQLEVIQRSGQVLISLLNDVLDFTKLEAHRFSLERVDFDLRTLLSDVERLFHPLAVEKGLAFSVDVPDQLGRGRRGDPLRLRQVLTNLLSNAVKFTERGEVRLTVTEPQAGVLGFSVRDSGVGISDELRARLFNPFEQADASTTRRYGGTGLGLAVVRQLVEAMGGTIQVTSAVGQGSTFNLTVPLDAGTPPPAAAASSPRPRVTSGQRLLVVDDNAINLKVASALAQKAGFEVDAVSSGQAAVLAARSGTYAAVLMDCHMPEMDGFETTRRIRALPGVPGEVLIIAVTASISAEDLAACERAGMREVLAKPISIEGLVAAVQRGLDSSGA